MTHYHYDHLYRARQLEAANLSALQLAEELNTPEEIAARTSELTAHLARTDRTESILAWACLSLLGAGPAFGIGQIIAHELGLISFQAMLHTKAIMAGGLLAGVLSMMVTSPWLRRMQARICTLKRQLEALRPIAGTPVCLDAATYVKSGAAGVLEWRDYAVAHHGQLYGFDVEVMRCLDEMTRAEQPREDKAAARKAELDAACRQAHGLALPA